MAKLSAAQKAMLKNIRNNQFVTGRVKGTAPRHPDKPATVYVARPESTVIDSKTFSKRPNRSTSVVVETTPVKAAESSFYNKKEVNTANESKNGGQAEAFRQNLLRKLERLGMSHEQWKDFLSARRENPELLLSDFRLTLG